MVLVGSFTESAFAQELAEPSTIQATWSNGRFLLSTAIVQNAPLQLQAPAPPVSSLDETMPAHLRSLVDSISRTHGVDPRLVAAVMKVESNYDLWARSPKGALGLMQLIPATGRRFGVRDCFDPAQNIEGGVRYLRFLSDKFGPTNLDLLLAAYNAGENVVDRLKAVPPYPETRNYVRKVRDIYKQESGPAVVAAAEAAGPAKIVVAEESAPPPANTNLIRVSVDERGVFLLSNIAPPN
jgi:hypothetical protein